jgi:hypothetical protein
VGSSPIVPTNQTIKKMKKILVLLVLYFSSVSVSNSQTLIDSTESITFSCVDTLSVDTFLEKKSYLIPRDSVYSHIDSTKTINNMENKKEKFITKKRIIIVAALVGLQIAFGFDPKFTIINLVWLAF